MKSIPKFWHVGSTKFVLASVVLAGLVALAVIGKWTEGQPQPLSPSTSEFAPATGEAKPTSTFPAKQARVLLAAPPAGITQPVKAAKFSKDLDFKFPLSFIAVEPSRGPKSEAPRERKEFERTIAPGEIGEGEHGGREDWFHAQRAYPLQEIPFGAMVNANEELAREEATLRLRALNSPELDLAAPPWTALGPAPIGLGQTFGNPKVPVSGRVNVLALDPGYNGGGNQTVYIGAATGGVWRTINNGTTWTPLFDDQPFLAIGALAIDPSNPNVIYAGTGEGKVTQGYYGVGLLKSTNGGANWSLITGPNSTLPPNQPAFINASFTKIAVDPVTPSTVFATTTIGLPNSASSVVSEIPPLGQRGVWRSVDSGQNWTNVDPPATGGNFSATDVLVDPTNHNRVFAVMRGVGVYRSTNGGGAGSWTKLAGGLPAETLWFRGNLAVGPAIAPSTNATIYAAFATPTSDLQGIYRSTDGGNNWTALVRPQVRGQANYNLGLAVDPLDANIVYYGTSANSNNNGGTLWRSTNGGQIWADLSQGNGTGGLHADTHFIAVSPANRNIVFTANDGGVFRTANATSATVGWTSLNQTLSLTQFQALALHPTNINLLLGGTQDNGTVRYNGNPSWFHAQNGDGGAALIDQSNPLVMYHTFFNRGGSSAIMGAEISFNGGDTWPDFVGCLSCTATAGQFNPNDRVSFYAPMALHTGFTGANGNVVYYGTHRLYRSANRGQSWFGIGPSADSFGTDLTKNQPNTQAYLTAISAHPTLNQNTNPPGEIVWVGTADGNVQVTANAGSLSAATWTNVTKAPLPNRYVTDIALDPNNQQRAVVAFSGFNANTTSTPGHVFLTVNGAGSWTDISGNLPDTPANSAVIDPTRANTYYIGTDIGVFQTTDGGATWIRMADGMPKVPVFMLRYHAASQNLVAATHGRGVYRAQVGTTTPPGNTEELKTDDGSAETGTVSDGLIIVNRMKPSAYPSTLQKVSIFVGQFQNQPNPSGKQIRLLAFTGSSNDTQLPQLPTLLLDQMMTIPAFQNAGFVEFTINNAPTIPSGDWYIGYQAPAPASGVGFFADTNGPQQQRAYFSTNNGLAYQGPLVFGGTPPVPANIMIRAIVGSGQANAPNIAVTPASLDFGSVNINATADRTLNVGNSGTATLNVTGITSSNARFSVTSATSFSVAAGGQQAITVRFSPTAAGIQTGTLTIASNDSAKPTVTAGLTGTGAAQGGDLVMLASGVAFNDTLPAPPAGAAVFNPVQYAIEVPAGATQLKIELNGTQDVDLFARFATRVGFGPNGVVADFSSDSTTGVEMITITPSSSPALQTGTYLIAVVNYGPGASSYSVKATVSGPQQCSYAISPSSQNFNDSGGQGSVGVTTANGCAWTAVSNAGFLTINSGASGNGSGAVAFTAAANNSASQRSGTMTIAGQTFTVMQSGLNCSYSISPVNQNFNAGGGNGSVGVTTANGCAWTAVSNAGFLTINSGASGSGNGSVAFGVAANSGSQRSGTMTIAGQTFTATQDAAQQTNRVVRVGPASGSPASTAQVPIELLSLGDENALGFSLTFDTAVLSNPQAALGSDANGASLNANVSQIAQGRVGIVAALPSGQRFMAGARQVVVVTFTIANTQATSTNIGFGDQPIAREVSDVTANALQANYIAGVVTITTGYEADVAPRPNGNGNGSVTVTDWVQVGRFVSVLDQVSAGSEYQRSDVAPKDTKGNGSLTVTDWVQAGRYAAGLDSVVTAGGPTAPSQLRIADFGMRNESAAQRNSIRNPQSAIRNLAVRTLKVINADVERGQRGTVIIELDAQGNENAMGFSLSFDPTQLQFISVALGNGLTGATLNVNTAQAANGRLGLAIALPAGQMFATGLRQIVVLTLAAAASGNGVNSAVSFGDSPIIREVSDQAANALPTAFANGTVTLTRSVATVSAASFLGQTLASEAIVAAFGGNLATTVVIASTLPLPTQLGGTTVKVKDSAGIERLAPLFFVAPSQVNYQIPPGTAAGAATVTITSGDGSVSTGSVSIAGVAPGLFTANANGQGLAAAVVLRVKTDGSLIYEPAVRFDGSKFVAVPIDLGPESDQVFLLLFGTGWRFRSSLAAVTVTLGGVNAEVLYASDPGEFTGQDQINLRVPRSLAGRGEIDVALTVDGRASNTVKISVK